VIEDPRRRIWEERYARGAPSAPPSPFIVEVLGSLPRPDLAFRPARRPRALDVACGAGRHALLLAAHGFQVTAVDYAHAALVRLRTTALAHDLTIDPLVADVESWPIPVARFDLVVVVDFLARSLLPALRAAVIPGGVLVMETFTVEQARHGHPRNPAYLLQPGELVAACRGWSILAAYDGDTDATPTCRAAIAARAPDTR
jgi:tellurite methyltransferase